ncbi:MAG: M23 family metallopeptidase, partial [Chloroflexi bacterium]|nr:M23 family metallopeptidase [Chloroflexota bacterium]
MDLYAPVGSSVLLPEDGLILEVSPFTSPSVKPYWNLTYAVTVKLGSGLVLRLAELETVIVTPGTSLRAGSPIGFIGSVLNPSLVSSASPLYIQELVRENHPSMLHIEMHRCFPPDINNYLGGNYFQQEIPASLMDPTEYLTNCTPEDE